MRPFSFSSVTLGYIIFISAFSLASETIIFNLSMTDRLIVVTRIFSKGSSLIMTPPKEVAENLNASESIGFYEVQGEIVARKIE